MTARTAPTTWAEVDPARHPFDPDDVPGTVRTIVSSLPRPDWPEDRRPRHAEAWPWIEAVSSALSDRYGPWAYWWHWGPGEFEWSYWIMDRIPAPAEAPAFVADGLTNWRRLLESLAEQFDRLRPQLDPASAARPGDALTAWQFAIADLLTAADVRTTGGDDWQGWCRRILQWFLTANGVPARQAEDLVDGATEERFEAWGHLTVTDVATVSEQLARDVLGTLGVVVGPGDEWPDTWPQDWPSWRATNTGWLAG